MKKLEKKMSKKNYFFPPKNVDANGKINKAFAMCF
jgi:hypothetical protein